MRTRPRHLLLAATATALTLVLTSCGGGGGGGGLAGSDEQQQGVNDINPLPRDQVRDGGDLRWPLDAIPDNFNRNQLDGTLLENREVMQALMPGAFVVAPDATLAVDEDYFTSIELTSQDPQVVTYTINPDATWDDGVPISWQDLQAQWQALRRVARPVRGAVPGVHQPGPGDLQRGVAGATADHGGPVPAGQRRPDRADHHAGAQRQVVG
jgi:peptide/nickel transport system substrate-binding protein